MGADALVRGASPGGVVAAPLADSALNPDSAMPRAPGFENALHVAVVIEGDTLKCWQHECVEHMRALGVRCTIVAGTHRKRSGTLRDALLDLFVRHLSRPRSLREKTAQAERAQIAESSAPHEALPPAEPDYLLCLDGPLDGRAPGPEAKHGAWWFEPHGGVLAFREMVRGEQTVSVQLKQLTNDGAAHALKTGVFKCHGESYRRTVDAIFSEIATWPAGVCRSLRRNRSRATGSIDTPAPSPDETTRRGGVPAFLSGLAGKRLQKLWHSLVLHTEWDIGLSRAAIDDVCFKRGVTDVVWLQGRDVAVRADPFVMRTDQGVFILYEALDYRTDRKLIKWMKVDPNGAVEISGKAEGFPEHASYPFLVAHEGAIYCVPETHREREIALYVAEDFPTRWSKVGVIADNVNGVDGTLFQHADHWWCAFCDQGRMADHNLSLAYAKTIQGPWFAHPANPVKIDVTSARPAGTPFVADGELYRPAQDCAGLYGSRITLNRIVRLTLEDFVEEPAGLLEPDAQGPYPCGLHTVSGYDDITVVDGRRRRFLTSGLMRKFRHLSRGYLQ